MALFNGTQTSDPHSKGSGVSAVSDKARSSSLPPESVPSSAGTCSCTEGEPTSEIDTVFDLLSRMSEEPGSIFDTVTEILSWGTEYSLTDFTLFISARGGMRVDNLYVSPKPYIIRIPVPDGKTVGDLMAALLHCPLPAAILHYLRATPGATKRIDQSLRQLIDTWAGMFLDVFEHLDGTEMLGWILAKLEERPMATRCQSEITA